MACDTKLKSWVGIYLPSQNKIEAGNQPSRKRNNFSKKEQGLEGARPMERAAHISHQVQWGRPFGSHVRYGTDSMSSNVCSHPNNLMTVRSTSICWVLSMCQVLGPQRWTSHSAFLLRGSWSYHLWWYFSRIKCRIFVPFDTSQKHNFVPIPACHWTIDLPFEGPSHLICKNWASTLTEEVADKG